MDLLLSNLGSSGSVDKEGFISMDQLRNAARALGDLSSARHAGSNLNLLGSFADQNSLIAPIKLDFGG